MRFSTLPSWLPRGTNQPLASDSSDPLQRPSYSAVSLLLLLSFSSLGSATSIVVVAQRDTILIAADSKSTYRPASDDRAPAACKVHVAKNVVFSSTGHTRAASDDTVYFDVSELIRTTANESDSLREIVDTFTEVVKQPLATSINTLRQRSPEEVPPGPALQTVFAGFENEQAVVYLQVFQVKFEQDRILVETRRTREAPSADQHLKLLLGVNDEMTRYDAAEPDWAAYDALTGIRHLIGLEIAANPEKVGPPIDIFLLTPESGRWIESKKECWDRDR